MAKLIAGGPAKNYAGYVETRAPFLAQKGDLVIGRMKGWKINVAKTSLEGLEVPNTSHYYLSDVLLLLAAEHLLSPNPIIEKIITYLQEYPHAVIRLYVLDQNYLIFLSWLKQQTGLDHLFIDANNPELGAKWNNKNILYPSVTAAKVVKINNQMSPYEVLELEKKATKLFVELGVSVPTLPGYLIQRKDSSLDFFCQQIEEAAKLLQSRYHLQRGCLKACESGDGARISLNIDLSDHDYLRTLARKAYSYGDDYVLESHVQYTTTSFGQGEMKLTPSAHIRSGKRANGITLQFTSGTSWMGNLYLNEQLAERFNISIKHYQQILQGLDQFLKACNEDHSGLIIGGMDYAIGQVGGKFGRDILLGLQDPNISFNGAEFLREFMDRIARQKKWPIGSFFSATWVFVPKVFCTHDKLEQLLEPYLSEDLHAMVIAVVPNFWAMIGVAALSYTLLVEHFEKIQTLINRELAK